MNKARGEASGAGTRENGRMRNAVHRPDSTEAHAPRRPRVARPRCRGSSRTKPARRRRHRRRHRSRGTGTRASRRDGWRRRFRPPARYGATQVPACLRTATARAARARPAARERWASARCSRHRAGQRGCTRGRGGSTVPGRRPRLHEGGGAHPADGGRLRPRQGHGHDGDPGARARRPPEMRDHYKAGDSIADFVGPLGMPQRD